MIMIFMKCLEENKMKLLMENWRRYITEEQQVQSEVEINTLEKNDDGTYSITVDLGSLTSLSKSMASMLQSAGGSMARTALLKALTGKSQGSVSAEISWKDISGNPTSPFSGAAQYVTATGTATAG